MNRRTLVMIISVAILAVFAVAVFLYSQTTPPQPPQVAQAPAQMPPDAPNGGNLVRFHSPVFGPAQAPVTIVEFFDPSCEACRAFYPHVKKILVENPSDVRLVLRYVLFHQGSEEVTRMLEAARKQNLYPQVLEAVLAAQPGWHDDPKVAAAWVAAEGAGLDVEKARADMHTPGVDAVLETDMQDVKTVGIRGTPTFFVNGRALSEFGPEPLRDLVRSEVAKARN
ncbi:thioredoxin domain-containing protein [Pseudomonas sp. MAP12]|jgi:protein-disulfide isomerase|uniref:Protein-disulfide isomerase n=2 Tax=Geopseudomonas TaxID=3236655 RepID=A0A1H2ELR5_9GAMM|nr:MULTISPECIES: thioredoxin domain-containing protein [Pseudomonas]MBV2133273.1 thioredoxin domain-containing protein [Pseudomonas aromaticivorans]WPP46124.1 thioredoxin domain-containing protein [Pseudomonas sp. AN-1]CAD5378526.1 Protein-disulfide isomerase [Pseudomonas sp. OF001]SDT95949.1 Protein-disulfide isomerase [Pseudomonas guangdongensis]